MSYYFFTVKIVRSDKPLQNEYDEWVSRAMSKNFNVKCYYYELDSLDRLHIHGIAIARLNYFYKRLTLKGVHTHIMEIEDHDELERIHDYLIKEQSEQYQQNLISYEIRNSQYPFQ